MARAPSIRSDIVFSAPAGRGGELQAQAVTRAMAAMRRYMDDPFQNAAARRLLLRRSRLKVASSDDCATAFAAAHNSPCAPGLVGSARQGSGHRRHGQRRAVLCHATAGSALIREIIVSDLHHHTFIEYATTGYEEYRASVMDWTLDLLFARDIEQMITLRDVEALSDLAGRIRARATQQTSVTAASTLEAAVRDQLK